MGSRDEKRMVGKSEHDDPCQEADMESMAVGPAGREGADEQGMAGCSQELHLYNICVRGYH